MTYNELKKEFAGYKLKTTDDDWKNIKKTNGNCLIEDYRNFDEDKEVYFETIKYKIKKL